MKGGVQKNLVTKKNEIPVNQLDTGRTLEFLIKRHISFSNILQDENMSAGSLGAVVTTGSTTS